VPWFAAAKELLAAETHAGSSRRHSAHIPRFVPGVDKPTSQPHLVAQLSRIRRVARAEAVTGGSPVEEDFPSEPGELVVVQVSRVFKGSVSGVVVSGSSSTPTGRECFVRAPVSVLEGAAEHKRLQVHAPLLWVGSTLIAQSGAWVEN
jgi:hypothetical protein